MYVRNLALIYLVYKHNICMHIMQMSKHTTTTTTNVQKSTKRGVANGQSQEFWSGQRLISCHLREPHQSCPAPTDDNNDDFGESDSVVIGNREDGNGCHD